jgi:uncharacterized protein
MPHGRNVMADTIHTLFLCGYAAENPEKATIPFVLANIEAEDKSKRVEVVLMFEGVRMAVKGAADGFEVGKPFETHDLGTRMRLFMEAGGIISVCTPCLILRNLNEQPLMAGIVKINGRNVLEKKDIANKILTFV